MTVYSYQIENGFVVDGTVSDGLCAAEWLMKVKGGVWVDSETPAWIGGTYNGTTFQPPYTEPIDIDDEELEPNP